MRGSKAKAIRMLAKYHVTGDRPELPSGGWHLRGACVLPKQHPRAKYQFLKKRYGMVPLASKLKRMHNSRRVVEGIDYGLQAQAQA